MNIHDLAITQEDILWVIPMERLITTVADDLWNKHLDPDLADMIFCLRKARQIKIAHILSASLTGTVHKGRSCNHAAQTCASAGINVGRG
jgi:hypothetical protein